jgi:DNA-binding response OmpR family regulator
LTAPHQITLEEAIAERDHYKRELGMVREKEAEARVASRLGLTGSEAALLMVLYARAGRCVTKTALLEAMYNGMDEPELKIIGVFVYKVRRKLRAHTEAEVIETIWGRGYQMTPAGVALVDAAGMLAQ